MSVRDIGLHLQSSSEIVHFHLEVGLLTVLPHLNYVATPHFVLMLRLRLAFELKLPNFGGRKHRSVSPVYVFSSQVCPRTRFQSNLKAPLHKVAALFFVTCIEEQRIYQVGENQVDFKRKGKAVTHCMECWFPRLDCVCKSLKKIHLSELVEKYGGYYKFSNNQGSHETTGVPLDVEFLVFMHYKGL